MSSRGRWFGLLLFGAAVSACGGSSDNTPATTIAKSGAPNGDGQTAQVATELPESLRVVVQEDGAPKAGVTVNWTTSGTGATVDPTSSITDANGLTATSWTLAQTSGTQTAHATLSGAGGSPVAFTATASPGPMVALNISAGNNQQPFVTTKIAILSVQAADAFGNGVPGQIVAWSVTSGTLTLDSAQSTSIAGGIAKMTALAGASTGPAEVRALVQDVDTVTFSLTLQAIPTSATVHTAGIAYVSARNNTSHPAVDTVVVGSNVIWDGLGSGTHLVRSTGSPTFTSQIAHTPSYVINFGTAGTYTYDCAIHGQAMTGRIVVLP